MSKLVSNSKNLLSSLSFKGSRITSSMNLSRSRSIQEQDFSGSEKIKLVFGDGNFVKSFKEKNFGKFRDVSPGCRLSLEQRKSIDNSKRLKCELDGIKKISENFEKNGIFEKSEKNGKIKENEIFGNLKNFEKKNGKMKNLKKSVKDEIDDYRLKNKKSKILNFEENPKKILKKNPSKEDSIVDETNVKLEESSKEYQDIENENFIKKNF